MLLVSDKLIWFTAGGGLQSTTIYHWDERVWILTPKTFQMLLLPHCRRDMLMSDCWLDAASVTQIDIWFSTEGRKRCVFRSHLCTTRTDKQNWKVNSNFSNTSMFWNRFFSHVFCWFSSLIFKKKNQIIGEFRQLCWSTAERQSAKCF